jgi:hypothetical protein
MNTNARKDQEQMTTKNTKYTNGAGKMATKDTKKDRKGTANDAKHANGKGTGN